MAKKPTKPKPKQYRASVACYPETLPVSIVDLVRELEDTIQKEVWLLVTRPVGRSVEPYTRIDFPLLSALSSVRKELPAPKLDSKGRQSSHLALLVDSGGGIAEAAFRVAQLLRRTCGGFTAVVPRFAKSAATLLALGASGIILGEEAELGPLDAQVLDFEEAEDLVSALDEVQAVDALEQSAIETAFRVMIYLRSRTGKKLNTLLPLALHFAAEITKPLFDKIDSVRFSRQSRTLQEAQDYAERLLMPLYKGSEAKAIARDLVRNYPTHGFVIDREEAQRVGKLDNEPPVGLQVADELPPELENLLGGFYRMFDHFHPDFSGIAAIGRIVEA